MVTLELGGMSQLVEQTTSVVPGQRPTLARRLVCSNVETKPHFCKDYIEELQRQLSWLLSKTQVTACP